MNPIKILIADDEELARQTIRQYLGNDTRFQILDDCEDGFSAVKSINQNRPDIVFLDIQMPRLNGFEVIELLDYEPVVIFSTAYDEYALKAFDANAIDYLLKPYSRQRFMSAVEKALAKMGKPHEANREIEKLSETVNRNVGEIDRIVIKDGSKIAIVPVQEVVYIESADDYVMIYTLQNRFLKQKTMSYFEAHLPGSVFLRIHRSFIVNINYINRLEPYGKETWIAILKGLNARLSVSKNGYAKIKEALKI